MTVRLILDRLEGAYAVLTADDGAVYECAASMAGDGAAEDDLFLAEIEAGRIISLRCVENPAAGENRRRLRGIFKSGKSPAVHDSPDRPDQSCKRSEK